MNHEIAFAGGHAYRIKLIQLFEASRCECLLCDRVFGVRMLRLCHDQRVHVLGEQDRIDALCGVPTFTGLHVVVSSL